MGFNLTPLIVKRRLTLEELRGRTLAVDANNLLYQFLALIRSKDGSPFSDSQGRITSHIVGLIMRTTRLMADYGIRPIFVFDGKPSELKSATLAERRRSREKAREEWKEAVGRGDYGTAWSKAVRMNSLTQDMQSDAKKVLDLLGIPRVQAIQEGEAQAAYMAASGDVWAVNSRDYDSVLFGSPRLVRYVTISGQEYLPSKEISRPLIPELIELELLATLQLTREQLVDLAILVGTDFNQGIRGVGPKTALKLLRANGKLESLPEDYREDLPVNIAELRNAFINPPVTANYDLEFKKLDENGLMRFLCEERGFGRGRILLVIDRMKQFYASESSKLSSWF
ncbi:MAG TPA: flap endonuclease-1 [Candidatus Bathyarchaeia archaeon]|nr:flap endonuclease-1 [Candidatus Bathyarchaeia archaeon]